MEKPLEQEALAELQTSVSSELQLSKAREAVKDNVALRQMRQGLHWCLLALLVFEILFIAYLMLSQGAKTLLFTRIPFELTKWEFIPFINIALAGTLYLIRLIALNLFSQRLRRHENN